ncbi:MAG TPA: nitrilase-related carbon-nitrogen hydrolase [Deinococcales bacterium]|nr:nitrilase-related carbon-nitrogen hydrolase [Deinococcales bacterium]
MTSHPGTLWLAAVQSRIDPDTYASEEAFEEWVLAQARHATSGRDPAEPALMAFPELLGMPLAFGLTGLLGRGATLGDAVRGLLTREWRQALYLGASKRNLTPSAFLLPGAKRVHRAVVRAFSRAARETNSTVVGGSAFLPVVDDEAALGTFLASARVRNLAYTFAPTGALVARSAKMRLTRGLESSIGLAGGNLTDVVTADTTAGRSCTLICYDAFFETALERADGLGASILVQPSANARPWDGPWSADRTLREGEEWLRRGPAARIQGRANLAYCLNPMLVGTLLGLEFEGRSSLIANLPLTGLPAGSLPDAPGVLAITRDARSQAVVTARVPHRNP